MIISIEKEAPSDLLICLTALSGLSQAGSVTPICLQHCLAKLHFRNRCLSVSTLCNKQSSQVYDSKCIFFLCRSPLVFNLSINNNQKKTLCLVHLDSLAHVLIRRTDPFLVWLGLPLLLASALVSLAAHDKLVQTVVFFSSNCCFFLQTPIRSAF
jgi:hypothetical protein